VNLLDLGKIIPKKYLIKQELLDEVLNFIAENMPKCSTGRPRTDNTKLIAGMYYLMKNGVPMGRAPTLFLAQQKLYTTDSDNLLSWSLFKKSGDRYCINITRLLGLRSKINWLIQVIEKRHLAVKKRGKACR